MSKKSEAITFLKAGNSPEQAMKMAGYRFLTLAGARSQASKLLREAELASPAPIHPSVLALDPVRRRIWNALTPQAQEWLMPDDDPDALPLAVELSTPWFLERSHFRMQVEIPRKPWDALSRAQHKLYKPGDWKQPRVRPVMEPHEYLAQGGAPALYQEYAEGIAPIPEPTLEILEPDSSGLPHDFLDGLAANAQNDEPVTRGEWTKEGGFISEDDRADMVFRARQKANPEPEGW
jgi:hypothetical protein